jgi:hypothetical protein
VDSQCPPCNPWLKKLKKKVGRIIYPQGNEKGRGRVGEIIHGVQHKCLEKKADLVKMSIL